LSREFTEAYAIATPRFFYGVEKMVLKYAVLLIPLLLVGCSGNSGPRTVEASGIVTLDGNPVEKAQVTFIDAQAINPAVAVTDAQGRFSLRYNAEKSGAVPGDYQVQVSKTILGTSDEEGTDISLSYGLPKKYSNIATSGLTQNVPESGIRNMEIKLQSE
jgi:hypothetical protein